MVHVKNPLLQMPFAVVVPEVQAPTFRGCDSPTRFLTNILHLAPKMIAMATKNPETAIRVEEADDQPSNFGCAIFRAIA